MTKQEFANRYLHPYKTNGDELVPQYCPFCHGGSNHDTNTFAFNVKTGAYNCMRGSCDAKGSFRDICHQFGEKTDEEVKRKARYTPKTYTKPRANVLKELPTHIAEYFKERGISKETLKKYNVMGNKDGNIVFPYFFGGELVLVKYKIPRTPKIVNGKKEKKSWQKPGGMPVLWGIDECDPTLSYLVIAEGEPDRLALIEAGVSNVTSMPFGTKNLDWVQTCWEYLIDYEKIIFWSDYDKAGRDMLDVVSHRLGIERCYYVNTTYKDANQQLLLYSEDIEEAKQSIQQAIEKAKLIPINDVVDMADINDMNFSDMEATYSDIGELDSIIGGFKETLVSIWSGKRGHGKSSVLNHLVVAETVEQGKKVAIYSGEVFSKIQRYLIELPLVGINHIEQKVKITGDIEPVIPTEYRDKMKNWYRGRIFLYDNKKSHKPKDVLARFEELAKRDGCKVFIIDSLMTLNFGNSEKEQFVRQGNFVRECKIFAETYNAHVHIVAHPRKVDDWKRITIEDVKGTGDITNGADNVFLVHRIKKKKEVKEGETQFNTWVQVVKNKLLGTEKYVGLLYDSICRRYYRDSWQLGKTYSWDDEVDDFSWLKLDEEE